MTSAFLVDFDGTACPHDVGASFSRRFARDPESAGRRAALAQWRAGAIGSRRLAEIECESLDVNEAQAMAFARGFRLDPGFAPFVAAAESSGVEVMVVSEGFDFYIHELLGREGLGHLTVTANRLRFAPGAVVPEFPWIDPACDRCGNCKGARVREHRARGLHVTLIGDGLSDRCGAGAADRVLAKGDLLSWCRSEGIAAESFTDFADVLRLASGWVPGFVAHPAGEAS